MSKIETLKVDRLVPYANNARTHSAEQVAQIAASIKQFGFNNPVLIDADDVIIAGHGRVMAARKLGLAEVPCLRLKHLTPNQVKAYVLADNRIAMNAGWDEELLAVEVESIVAGGEVDPALLGFSQEELDKWIGKPGTDTTPPESDNFDYQQQFGVIVSCASEQEQEQIYKRLCGEGFTCKVVCV